MEWGVHRSRGAPYSPFLSPPHTACPGDITAGLPTQGSAGSQTSSGASVLPRQALVLVLVLPLGPSLCLS